MIAAIYARKSTEQAGIADEQKSVTRQIEQARAYAQRKGWTVDDACIFVDEILDPAILERACLRALAGDVATQDTAARKADLVKRQATLFQELQRLTNALATGDASRSLRDGITTREAGKGVSERQIAPQRGRCKVWRPKFARVGTIWWPGCGRWTVCGARHESQGRQAECARLADAAAWWPSALAGGESTRRVRECVRAPPRAPVPRATRQKPAASRATAQVRYRPTSRAEQPSLA